VKVSCEKTAQLTDTERKELFSETANIKGISPAIIEKDFWVCWTLKKTSSTLLYLNYWCSKVVLAYLKYLTLLNAFQKISI